MIVEHILHEYEILKMFLCTPLSISSIYHNCCNILFNDLTYWNYRHYRTHPVYFLSNDLNDTYFIIIITHV